MRSGKFTVSMDLNFANVIDTCRELREFREGTWITDEIRDAYLRLYDSGYGHSVEVWEDEKLVGGLYGVALGKVFYGESMFSLADNSSKVALAALAWAMRQRGLELLDCQVSSDHLQTMGAELIPREEFNSLLVSLVQPPYERGPWSLPGTYMATEALL